MAMVTLLGCTSSLEPAEPVWGKEPCAHCMMLVSERAPSAQALLEGGQRKFFDDVGCMVLYVEREGVTPKAWWVRVGDGWKRAEEARYAREHTPMDFGFVGASEGVTFDEVKAAVKAKGSARTEMMP
jgi:hypothetical protein